MSLINFVRIYFTYDRNFTIALTVSATLIFTVLLAKIIGGVLPLLAKTCKLDPAIMAAPLITTIVDAGSLMIYFHIASLLISKFHTAVGG